MTIEAADLKILIIETLSQLEIQAGAKNLSTDSALDLLMGISAQESHLGRYLYQIRGPAKGIFQIEPATERDVWQNYLRYKKHLADGVFLVSGVAAASELHLAGNLIYQICIARVILLRVPERLPAAGDIDGLARYWKKYWNTHLGKGTIEEFQKNWARFLR